MGGGTGLLRAGGLLAGAPRPTGVTDFRNVGTDAYAGYVPALPNCLTSRPIASSRASRGT